MKLPRLAFLALPIGLVVGGSLWSASRGAFPGSFTIFGTIPLNVARQAPSCGACHGAPRGEVTVHVALSQYSLELTQSISVTTSATGGAPGNFGGFVNEVTAGSFSAGANSQINGTGKVITHLNPLSRRWSYSYNAPPVAGPIELFAVVNTVDGSGFPGGDLWELYTGNPTPPAQTTPIRLYANAAGVTDAGTGCIGSFRNQPVLGAVEEPLVGNSSFACELIGAPPNAAFTVFIGGLQPVPIDLAVIGITGCLLHVTPLGTLGGSTGPGDAILGEGTASIALPIPSRPALAGGDFFVQVALADLSSGRPLPVTLTNAVRVVMRL